MYTLDLPDSCHADAYGVFDIETTGFDGATDTLVAMGVGYYDGEGPADVEVVTLASVRNDEVALMGEAFAWLDRHEPEVLVTYNGTEFDLPFLAARVRAIGVEPHVALAGKHVDLFRPRRRLADQADEPWPSLEQCLEAYGRPVAETIWNGDVLTNKVFGEALGPRYVRALERFEFRRVNALEPVIREYTAADIEATIALYEADAGRPYTPAYAE